MPLGRIHFNCGEFLPGKEPLTVRGVVPPTPPVIIPTNPGKPIPPAIPGRPQEWVCICDAPCNSSVGYPNTAQHLCLSPNSRRCVEKWTVPTGTYATVNSYPSKVACESDAYNHEPCLICGIKCVTDSINVCISPRVGTEIRRHCEVCPPAAIQPAECNFTNMQHCRTACPDQDCISKPQGPITPRPLDPTNPGRPQPARPTGPTTSETRFKCQEITIYCPGDSELPVAQRRIKEIVRNCALCTKNANNTWPEGCIHTTKSDCLEKCASSEVRDCSNNTGVIIPTGPITGSRSVPTSTGIISIPSEPGNNGVINNPEPQIIQEPVIIVINVNQQAAQSEPGYNEDPVNEPSSQIYHKLYNFFNNTLGLQERANVFVQNAYLTNIFSTQVTREVMYFINRSQSESTWSEEPLFALTPNMIKDSISPILKEAFSKIHNIGGQVVNPEFFYTTVLNLLVTGRIGEFDPNYYISLAQKQVGDTFIKYEGASIHEYMERASLGLISNGGINADTENYEGFNKNRLKRQRRLNTDIAASIEVTELETPELVENLYTNDIGIEVVNISGESQYLTLGDGDGYYISSNDILSNEYPLKLSTLVSAAYYVPPDVRYNALTIMKENPGITLQVSSLSGQGEFTSGYDYTSVGDPLYFILDLSTISDGIRANPLVDIFEAQYKLEADEGIIRQHSINYGLAISKLNIDYRDPFYHYARDTGIIDFTQKDITFRSFSINRTSVNEAIITRNVPFALILTPGCGSTHNPLNGESELVEYESDVVIRKITVVPDININDSSKNSPLLEERNIYEETGGYKIGLDEVNDAQNVVYIYNASSDIFNTSYFVDNTYSKDPPTSIERHPLSKFVVSTIDTLITEYSPTELTWWDLIRRLPLNQYASIGFNTSAVFNSIESGWRGVPVRNVLSRLDTSYTGLNGLDSDDISIKITADDRVSAKIY